MLGGGLETAAPLVVQRGFLRAAETSRLASSCSTLTSGSPVRFARPEELARFLEQHCLAAFTRDKPELQWCFDGTVCQCTLTLGKRPRTWNSSRLVRVWLQFASDPTHVLIRAHFATQQLSSSVVLDPDHKLRDVTTVREFPVRFLDTMRVPCHPALREALTKTVTELRTQIEVCQQTEK
jgi:hypothetical protein